MGEGHWGMAWCTKRPGEPWREAALLARAPSPLYNYPTNALALAPNGTRHLVIEWLKTYPENRHPAHSMAVSHLESPDGIEWFHTDGREVKHIPVGIEDTSPILFRGAGNLRPGNVAVLPDGRPCVAVWDAFAETMALGVRQADRSWRVTDISDAVMAHCPGTHFNSCAQISATPSGEIVLVLPRAETTGWSHATTQLHAFRLSPDSAEILRHDAVPKTTAGEPDWLASIEKTIRGHHVDDPYVTYITGQLGTGCVNEAQCQVKLVHLT